MGFDVFISYPHQEKTTAYAACATLEAAGIRCWIAPRDVPAGIEWAAAILDAIQQCQAMVLIFSANANRSRQVHREVQAAFDQEKLLIPFRIENVAAEKALGYYISAVHWLDALDPPLEQHLIRLRDRLQGLFEKQQINPKHDKFAAARVLQAERLRELQAQIDEIRDEVKTAANKGDYQRAGELLYAVIPDLQKRMADSGGEDRAVTEANLKKLIEANRKIAEATMAISRNPDDAQAFHRRANAYYEKEDYDRALFDYDAAIRIEPNDDHSLFYRALINRYELGRIEEAIADLDRAITLRPDNALYYASRADLLCSKGKHDQAIENYKKATQFSNKEDIRSRNGAFRDRAWDLKSRNEYSHAILYYDEAIRLEPNDPGLWFWRGWCRYKNNECHQAEKDISQAIVLKSADSYYWYWRGLCHFGKAEYDRSIRDFDQAIVLKQDNPMLFSSRALAYIRGGDYSRAIEDCSKALSLNPKSAIALCRRSIARRELGQIDAADDDLRAAKTLNPNIENFFQELES